MKIIQLILLFLLISLVAFADPATKPDTLKYQAKHDTIKNLTKRDTLKFHAKNDTLKYQIRLIKFDQSFRTDTFAVDTSPTKLHILNPAFINEHSYIYLIRLGYPILSNSLVSRLQNNNFFFPANVFMPYIQDAKNIFFYDTKKPFTSLSYSDAGAESNNEEHLQVLHTQNISKRTNIGLFYNLYSSYSNYNFQQASDHALNIFHRYSGKNYFTYNQFYYNSFTLQENGGIVNDDLVDYSKGNYDGLNVNLQTAASKFKRSGFNSVHELKLKFLFGNKTDTLSKPFSGNKADSLSKHLSGNKTDSLSKHLSVNKTDTLLKRLSDNKTDSISKHLTRNKIDSLLKPERDYGSIIYNFNIEKSDRNYTDQDAGSFYKNYYFRSNSTNDSLVLERITNRLLLNSPDLSKYLPNLRLSLTNDLYYSTFNVPHIAVTRGSIKGQNDTSVIAKITNFQVENTWAGVDISQKFRQIWWNFIGNIYLLGYSRGDQSMSASANMFLDRNKTIYFLAKASEESRTPSLFYEYYFSNHFKWLHFKWLNSFVPENRKTISAKVSMLKPFINVSADYIECKNYIYFGNDSAVPVQAPNTMYILAFRFESKFDFWKFSTENSVIYQENSSSYIHTPKLIFYNSTTFHHIIHFFTGGKIFFRLGFDLYYQTTFKDYYPDAYNPATGAFYLQNNEKALNYPQIDFHLTMKIKTVSFFLKYSHANAGYYGDTQVFVSQHYPMLPAVFSYGINWLFYD